MRITSIIVIATSSIVMLMGCSDATTPTTPTDQIVVVIPKVGSFYIYEARIAETGKASQTVSYTLNVVASGLTIDGRPNVVAFMSTLDNDSLYFIYGSNGDFLARSERDVWDTMPFGSKVSGTWLDTTYYTDRPPLTMSTTLSYLRTETVTVQGTPLSCVVIQAIMTGHFSDGGRATRTTTIWYAHSIGFEVKVRSHTVFTLPAEVVERLITQNLIKYSLIK